MNRQKLLIIILLVISGTILLLHHTIYQPMVSPGDHGRDLAGFVATMQGATPYQDYWWVYGPLMPYYYGTILKIFGISIQSVLIGKLIINLLSGIFFFLILSLIVPELFAFVGTLYFWIFKPQFFYTYNHVAGITMLLAATYYLFSYIKDPRPRKLYWGLAAIFILCLIKLNFGLAALSIFLISIFITDRCFKNPPHPQKKWIYLLGIIGLPLAVAGIYYLFLHGLPVYAIRQCMPFHSSDHPHNASIFTTLAIWAIAIFDNINVNWPNRFFALLLITSISYSAYLLWKGKMEKPLRKQAFLFVAILVVFYAVSFHEYLVSGVIYRTYWAKPFSILMMFFFFGFAGRYFSRTVQYLMLATIFYIVFLRFNHEINIVKNKIPEQYISLERGQILTGNNPHYIQTVQMASRYLQTELKDDQQFFALPYDPIYYFLTDRPTPTRQTIFFEHIKIPEVQENRIIADLEIHHVNHIVLSSRHKSGEPGMGLLGTTYCPLIGKYLEENFEVIAVFGDWENPPGWAWNHGVKILKRIEPL